MEEWRPRTGRRGRVVFVAALAGHGLLVGAMLLARLTLQRSADTSTVMVTLWQAPTSRVIAPTPAPLARPRVRVAPAPLLRALASPAASPEAIRAPPVEASAARAPTPVASAASQPLNLTLSRDQLRALIAGARPTLAQSLASPPAPSALSRLAGDDVPDEEVQMPGGVTEVHVHGGCVRMVPTPRSQYDPFNHGGERLAGPCLGGH